MGSLFGGGGSKLKTPGPGPLELAETARLGDIERTLGLPFRRALTPAIATIGGPGVFQTELPAADREALESQFTQARRNVLETAPARGGLKASLLSRLESDRAGDIASAVSGAKQRGIERALGLTGAFLPGAEANRNLIQNEQNRRLAAFQAQQQNAASSGSGLGSLLGGGLSLLGRFLF